MLTIARRSRPFTTAAGWASLLAASSLVGCSGSEASAGNESVGGGTGTASGGTSPGSGGATGTAAATAAGGNGAQPGAGGSTAVGGTSSTQSSGGTTNTPSTGGTTNTPSTGGTTNTPSTGGTTNTPSTGGQNSNTGGTTTSSGCGAAVTINSYPFGCEFAWGAPSEGNNSSYLDFVSTWVGYESRGGLDGDCQGCNVVNSAASTSALVVYYAYFIGYQANLMAGYGDCNTDSNENLCTNGAQWIRENRDLIVQMYGNYAAMTYAANSSKPTIWWLEGDFIQYSYAEQTMPLSYQELGDLTRDITCAIKASAPNATVAMNHSPWIADDLFEGFWGAMPMDVLDMAWVQGPGNSGTYVNEWGQATANYASLHAKIGRPIMAETSFAPSSGQDNLWTTASVSDINARISEGVIGVLNYAPDSNYQSAIGSLTPLNSVCQ